MLIKKIIFLALLYHAKGEFKYNEYSLYKIVPNTEEKLEVLQSMMDMPYLDFFQDPVRINGVVSVMVEPKFKFQFLETLKTYNIEADMTIEDVQKFIDNQEIGKNNYRKTKSMSWDDYYTLEDIYAWLEDVASENSGTVTVIIGGTSYENREIKGVKISHGSGRKSIFIEGGIHAREWISPATVNYIISELVYSSDSETKAAAMDFDWYIFPVTNPDGYIWTHTEERLWRKNRKPVGNDYGIDLNRNWNSNWLDKGSSVNTSSNTYAGIGPFSEVETRTLSEYIESVSTNMEMYLSFHSSGQLFMVPFGNTTDPLDNYYDTVKIGRRAMGSLSVRHGTLYVTGNIAEAIYEATGSSVDWVKEKLHVPLVFCYELRDKGEYGHLLPPEQIKPNNEEVMDSVLALIREGRAMGYFNSSPKTQISSLIILTVFVYYMV